MIAKVLGVIILSRCHLACKIILEVSMEIFTIPTDVRGKMIVCLISFSFCVHTFVYLLFAVDVIFPCLVNKVYCIIHPGTLLASGSDDLNIVVWKWAESKQFFTFDSGHRSNVFQVSCFCT